MEKPTEEIVEELLSAGLWFDSLRWNEEKSGIYVCRAKADWDPAATVALQGTVNVKMGKIKWVLFYNGKRIAGLCYVPGNIRRHHNPTCDRIGHPHLHRWTDKYEDKLAELVEIPGRIDELTTLYWLYNRWNMRVGEDPGRLPVRERQGRLFGP